MEFFSNFKWAVSYAFSDAVALCRFEEGDMLYDTKKAYSNDWKNSLKSINYSMQVMFPTRVTTSKHTEVNGIFEKNWDSEVRINLYKKQEKTKIGQIHTTQGRLYTALWKGDINILDIKTKNPSIPINVKVVNKQLIEIESKAIAVKSPVFVMAYDYSNPVSRDKFNKIHEKLKLSLKEEPIILSPKELEMKNHQKFSPTINIALFITNIESSELHELIKKAVYIPSKGAKKEMFRLKSHGVIFNG